MGDGSLDIGDRAEDGDEDGRPGGDVDDPSADVVGLPMGKCKHQQDDRHGGGLGDHFPLAGPDGGEVASFALDEASEAGDEEFAAEDEDSHPRVNPRRLEVGDLIADHGRCGERGPGEADEGAEDEDLVGEGVHDAAEAGDAVPGAGEFAIEDVGDGGEDEDGGGGEEYPGGFERCAREQPHKNCCKRKAEPDQGVGEPGRAGGCG